MASYLSYQSPVATGHFQTQLAVGNWLFATTHIKPCATECTVSNLLHKRELVAKGSTQSPLRCSVVGLPEPAVGLPAQSKYHVGPVGFIKLDRSLDIRALKEGRRDLAVAIRPEQAAVHDDKIHPPPFQVFD